MGGYERQNQASSSALEPSSRASAATSSDAPSPARVTLPSDLAASLKYLDDAQLQRLLEAVTVEINRRNQGASNNEAALVATPVAQSQHQLAASRNKKISGIEEIPEGKANLIRASFKAGFKPAAIARTFRISQPLVNRILSSTEKPKR
jgi:hypothetical protein